MKHKCNNCYGSGIEPLPTYGEVKFFSLIAKGFLPPCDKCNGIGIIDSSEINYDKNKIFNVEQR
jgi:hypothetical protein